MPKRLWIILVLFIMSGFSSGYCLEYKNSPYDPILSALTYITPVSSFTADTLDIAGTPLYQGQIRLSWKGGKLWDDTTQYDSVQTFYLIRYYTQAITTANWSSSTPISQNLTPAGLDTTQTLIVPTTQPITFDSATTFFFGMRTVVWAWMREMNSTGTQYDTSIVCMRDTSTLVSAAAGTKPKKDGISPNAITDLVVSQDSSINPITGIPRRNRAIMTFTVPGDDYSNGRAYQYRIKYSTVTITNANFNQAATYPYTSLPRYPGETDTIYLVDSLLGGRVYYLAIKTLDEANNSSEISNVDTVYMRMLEDNIAPDAITDLQARPGTLHGSVQLTWTAPEDNPYRYSVKQYCVKYQTYPFYTGDEFDNALTYAQNWTPLQAGEIETRSVTGLTPHTTYYFAIKSIDFTSDTSLSSNLVAAMARDSLVLPHYVMIPSDSLISVFDTLAIQVWLKPPVGETAVITGASFYTTINDTFFYPLDMDPYQAGVQPFVSADFFPQGIVLENDLHGDNVNATTGAISEKNNIKGYQLDYSEAIDTTKLQSLEELPEVNDSSGWIATFYLVARKNTTGNTIFTVDQDQRQARISLALDQSRRETPSQGIPFYMRVKNYLAMVHSPLQGRHNFAGVYTIRALTAATRLPLANTYSPLHLPLSRSVDAPGYIKIPHLPIGSYIILVKEPRFLTGETSLTIDGSKIAQGIVKTTLIESSIFYELRGGDANNDNIVNLVDFGTLCYYFNSNVPISEITSGSRWSVDFNNDGAINLADFSILVSNFGEHGSLTGETSVAKTSLSGNPQLMITQIQGNYQYWLIQAMSVKAIQYRFSPDYPGSGAALQTPFPENSTLNFEKITPSDKSFVYARLDPAGQDTINWLLTLPNEESQYLQSIEILDSAYQLCSLPLRAVNSEESETTDTRDLTLALFPNPFNSQCQIQLNALNREKVELTIYNLTGEVVQQYSWPELPSGKIQITWPPTTGDSHPTGIYFYDARQGKTRLKGKMMLMK